MLADHRIAEAFPCCASDADMNRSVNETSCVTDFGAAVSASLRTRLCLVGLTDRALTCAPASQTTQRRGAAVAAPNKRFGRSELQLP
jgi:hypothetical protein